MHSQDPSTAGTLKDSPSADLDFDRQHIWHPYTSMTQPIPVYPVASAKGVHIILEDGTHLIDGMSSWWCAVHGYNHPHLNQAVKDQIDKVSHVMFGGLTHSPAIELSRKLVALTPEALDKVFLCDSGSVSVEVALKMALQYQFSRGESLRTKLITIKNGYHGDTFGAMSVCDPENGMHHIFQGALAQQVFMDAPSTPFGEALNSRDEENLNAVFENHAHEAAAFILEPIVQGAGGMRMYSAAFLAKVRELCDRYDVLLIVDEIATGFGRTGKWFATEHAAIQPDIMCLGKALTGGMMTMAATLCTDKIATTISDGEAGVFMHGPTFMANPLACSVALASLELLESYDLETQILNIEQVLRENLSPLSNHPRVNQVRVLGAIGVVECKQNIAVGAIQKHFIRNNVWIRPFRNLIYLMPPFISQADDLRELCRAIETSLDDNCHFG